MSSSKKELDFVPFGAALKQARTGLKLSRNAVADLTGLAPRYIAQIENRGQRPSLQAFYLLITTYKMPVDALFFPDKVVDKTIERRPLDSLLDELSDSDLDVVLATASALLKARSKEE